jgi:hypothetical protein
MTITVTGRRTIWIKAQETNFSCPWYSTYFSCIQFCFSFFILGFNNYRLTKNLAKPSPSSHGTVAPAAMTATPH